MIENRIQKKNNNDNKQFTPNGRQNLNLLNLNKMYSCKGKLEKRYLYDFYLLRRYFVWGSGTNLKRNSVYKLYK